MEAEKSKTVPETAFAPKNEPKGDSADSLAEVEAKAPKWSDQLQRSVVRGLASGQEVMVAAAATVDAAATAGHAARIVGLKEGGALGVKLNIAEVKDFAKRVGRLAAGSPKTKMRQIAKMKFKLLDINGDGVIDQEEVAMLMTDMGVLWHVFGEGDPVQFFKDCDKDQDGFISREEFVKAFSALNFAKAFGLMTINALLID